MIRTRLRLLPVVLLGLAACADTGGPADPLMVPDSPPATVLFDGSTDGNPHFYWLPPIASNPTTSGVVNMGLASAMVLRVCPGVELCASPAFDAASTPPALAEFTDAGGTGGAAITLGDDNYQVNWKTSDTNTGVSLAGQTVRLWVLLGKVPVNEQVQVGFVDLVFASDGSQARGRAGDALREGRMLPIRFRMENGVAFGGDCVEGVGVDCVEFVASDAGFDECTEETGACLTAAEGWLPEGISGPVLVQVQQEPLVNGSCFDGLPLPQREACYRITTVPDFGGAPFPTGVDVLFSICPEPGMPENFEIHQRTGLGELRRPISLDIPVPGLDCNAFQFASMTPLSRFATRLGEWIFGRPLHALDGLTARLSSFSEFFWGPAATFGPVTIPATAQPGDVVPVQIQLALDHGNSGDLGGIQVNVAVDDGTLPSGSFVSGPTGQIAFDWTVPTAPGTYDLTATIPVIVASIGAEPSVTVQVEVVAAGPPVGTVQGSVTDASGGAIQGVTVTIPGLPTASTDVNGSFLIANVPPGTQKIDVGGLTPFRPVVAYAEVIAGQTTTQDVALPSTAAPFVLDQVHDPVPTASGGCPFSPTFQSFTAGTSLLGRVELRAAAFGGFPPGGTSNTINIRDGSPTGDILASVTKQVQVAEFADVWVDFEIVPALVTEPGQVLVIEWDLPGTQFGWYEESVGTYGGGSGFGCGADPPPAALDRLFRTSSF